MLVLRSLLERFGLHDGTEVFVAVNRGFDVRLAENYASAEAILDKEVQRLGSKAVCDVNLLRMRAIVEFKLDLVNRVNDDPFLGEILREIIQ